MEGGENRQCGIISFIFPVLDRRGAGESPHGLDTDYRAAALEVDPVAPVFRFVLGFEVLLLEGTDDFTNRARFTGSWDLDNGLHVNEKGDWNDAGESVPWMAIPCHG